MARIWDTKEKIINEAKKYASVTEFQKGSGGAFNAARRLNIINEFTWLKKVEKLPFGYWRDKKHCMEEAKKYSSKKEFQKNNQSAYWASLKYGYLDEMTWLSKRKSTKRGLLKDKSLILTEGKKYATKSEFEKNNRSAYEAARRYGWLTEMDWFIEKKQKPKGYWSNKEAVFNEAKKYSSRTEFKDGSNGAYNAAKKNKWLEEMPWLKSKSKKGSEHIKRRWKTKEDIIEESKKFTSRSEFNKKSKTAYEIARKNKWLDEMVWLVNKNVYVDKVDSIYKYYFKEKNAIYIGRTVYTEIRDKQHRNTKNDSVYRFAEDNKLAIPKMEIIESDLNVLQGIEREKYWESFYKNKGFIIINKAPCGSIGSMASGKWNKKNCIEESKKYSTRGEFFLGNSNAYQKSIKEGWIEEMNWLSSKRRMPRGYWTIKENVINEAKKYKSKNEFEKNNVSAFLAAYKHGWLNEIKWEVIQHQKPSGFWNKKENVIEESKKYNTFKDFRNSSTTAYRAAKKNGYLDEMFWLSDVKKKNNHFSIKHPKGYWKDRNNIMEEAKKYSTKQEFQKKNLSAFLAAHKYGYIDEMEWLARRNQHKWGYWTYKNIEKEALKYNTKTEFFKKNQTAYRAALKLGIIDDFFLNDYVEY